MRIMRSRIVIALLAVVAVSSQGFCLDYGRVLKSAVFPGMGQLGDGQTIKGVGFMAGEVILLTVMFNELSRSMAYAAETDRLRIKYGFGGTYTELVETHEKWGRYYNDSEKSRNLSLMFGGLAALCWGVNIADALFLAPAAGSEEVSLLREAASRTTLSFAGDQSRIVFTTEF